ncbi:scaffolding protein [Streptomyces phage Janus]|uniref:Scaffolding protein n=1 Tax=Streptomyces phage Janus TaxID=2510525 RepID=A0A411CPP9_9CAUD|nr:head scaffolding protein [Streptomyces phage Janus]ATI18873.1 scaffolding protein [Streptomyces phage SqueakyClean]QAY15914.1 scaffolding protein [Streptomyces phage Janus]QFG10678.1 scaffolding protein [Streptomyces phage Animus]
MPEQESTETSTETTTEETVETPQEGTTPDEGATTEESTEEKPAEETVPPEVLRKKLTDANAEAANYRTKLRETEAKLSSAKTLEEFEAATSELRGQIEALERQILLNDVAAKYELPPALAKRLTGTTAEELDADAKELQKLVAPSQPESLSGGLDPEDDEEDFDPVKAVANFRRNRY